MESQNQENVSDPWNDSVKGNNEETGSETSGFQDDFQPDASTILELPDSDKYLESLERRLSKVQPKVAADPQLNKRNHKKLVQDLIESLKAKRDEIFRDEISQDVVFDAADESRITVLQRRIIESEVWSEISRRIAPQSQVIDPEELKTLISADFLNQLFIDCSLIHVSEKDAQSN